MYIEVNKGTYPAPEALILVLRCPTCDHNGTFQALNTNDVHVQTYRLGHRTCPNPNCRGHLFFIYRTGQTQEGDVGLVATYPPERIDFKKDDIPEAILEVFEEALTCHANQCYIAAAIMVRRTLEEICEDRGATDGLSSQGVELAE